MRSRICRACLLLRRPRNLFEFHGISITCRYADLGFPSSTRRLILFTGGNGAGATPVGTQETPGALGRGESFANAFVLLFLFLAYAIPIYGAYVADVQLGRYKVIMIGVLLCGVAHVIMIAGAAPSVLQAGHGVAPFLISFFLLAFGAGR